MPNPLETFSTLLHQDYASGQTGLVNLFELR